MGCEDSGRMRPEDHILELNLGNLARYCLKNKKFKKQSGLEL